MASMTTVVCRCGKEFQARTADVNRGWGKYCSKSCKGFDQGPIRRETTTTTKLAPTAPADRYCLDCGDVTNGPNEPRCEHHAILHEMGDSHGQWE